MSRKTTVSLQDLKIQDLKSELEKMNEEIKNIRELVHKLMNCVYYGNDGHSLREELAQIKVKMVELDKLMVENRKFISRMMIVFWGTFLSFIGSLMIFIFNVMTK
ncbi:MAG: hypothetical protein ABDI07_11705 [Candidatus Kryptonium sp.]